jgi:hypothetical protein
LSQKSKVPKAFQIQFARLFGSESKLAKADQLTDRQWRVVLRRVLHEFDRYVSENVETDAVHLLMLSTGLYAADQSLNDKDFWPGYAEGVTRALLIPLGDYPDHHRRKGGRKKAEYYSLDLFRQLRYLQNSDQKFRTLVAAFRFGAPQLSKSPLDALSEFRQEFGYAKSHREFLEWYRKRYPSDYAAVF